MYLKTLTIRGFKSFAQPTTFEFEPGVTAIVGPNGSGKSNVVDALAWVMGEQGAKSLRGGKMEDVIFAGTSSRGPLGRAEVKLTIDNSDGLLPIDYSEVTIGRILFRNGASEYTINGEACRLLDVQELLSDTGLGNQMHVIVGQGQLDAVLRATSEDRRAFIEEAAGILKHRKRKERTLRKLDAMEANLTRLNDLAAEIRRQLKPLGRQAEVAKEAQFIAAEVRDARARILADDVQRVRSELYDLTKDEAERHTENIVLKEQHEQKLLRIEMLEKNLNSDEIDDARRTSMNLERAQGRLRGLYEQTQQRLTFLATQNFVFEDSGRVTDEAVAEARREEEQLTEEVPGFETAFQNAVNKTLQAKNVLDAIDEEIAEQTALISRYDLSVAQLRSGVKAAEEKFDLIKNEQQRREKAREEAETRLQESHAELKTFEEENGENIDPTPAYESAYKEADQKMQVINADLDSARNSLNKVLRDRAGLEAKAAALGSSLADHKAAQSISDSPESLGTVAEHVRPNEGYELATNAALGALAEATLVADEVRAADLLERVKNEKMGRLSVVIAAAPKYPYEKLSHRFLAGSDIVPLIEVIDAPEGVKALLAQSFVAPSFAAGRQAIREISQGDSVGDVTVVTKDGDLVTEHFWQAGSLNSPSAFETIAELEKTEKVLAETIKEIGEQEKTVAGLKEALSAARALVEKTFADLRGADAQFQNLQREKNRLSARIQAAHEELARLTNAKEQSEATIAEALKTLQAAQQNLERGIEAPRPVFDEGQREAAFQELETARGNELEKRIALETVKERVRAANENRITLEKQVHETKKALEEAARKEALRKHQIFEAERVAKLLPKVLKACDESLAKARVEQQQLEKERAESSKELNELRAKEREIRKRLEALTELSHSVELQAYERKLQLSNLLERAGEDLGLVEDVLLAEYGPEVLIPLASAEPKANVDELEDGIPYVREEQEKRLKHAEKKLRELGRINPLALEEFAALEQRHSFLTEQLQDLEKTRQDLLSIISELDNKMEGIFADAFEDTKKAFEEVFPVLFPGGSGDISLTDPNNMLTTGIDVAVRPAGKKVERLSLLSGGERSLAAVAWLIAIFKARPSPFYIMDEVEAALDDANLGRLLQVFSQLRENSQLIVITHQKRTMEVADALYGVSMRGDGISVVVGQRIAQDD